MKTETSKGGVMKTTGYDSKCADLALAFLEDYYDPVPETRIADLAQVIQDAIEDWFSAEGI